LRAASPSKAQIAVQNPVPPHKLSSPPKLPASATATPKANPPSHSAGVISAAPSSPKKLTAFNQTPPASMIASPSNKSRIAPVLDNPFLPQSKVATHIFSTPKQYPQHDRSSQLHQHAESGDSSTSASTPFKLRLMGKWEDGARGEDQDSRHKSPLSTSESVEVGKDQAGARQAVAPLKEGLGKDFTEVISEILNHVRLLPKETDLDSRVARLERLAEEGNSKLASIERLLEVGNTHTTTMAKLLENSISQSEKFEKLLNEAIAVEVRERATLTELLQRGEAHRIRHEKEIANTHLVATSSAQSIANMANSTEQATTSHLKLMKFICQYLKDSGERWEKTYENFTALIQLLSGKSTTKDELTTRLTNTLGRVDETLTAVQKIPELLASEEHAKSSVISYTRVLTAALLAILEKPTASDNKEEEQLLSSNILRSHAAFTFLQSILFEVEETRDCKTGTKVEKPKAAAAGETEWVSVR
jgi:hypothetical protein